MTCQEPMREDILKTKSEKLERLRKAGEEAYPEKTNRSMSNGEALERFDELQGQDISLVGRVRSFRPMGKIAFAHIEDESGKIQVFLRKGALSDERFDLFVDTVEIGDFVEASGALFLTKQGERTLEVKDWRMLGKSMRPVPTEFYGLKDEEELLRRRYLDLLLNPETREMFRRKAKFWNAVRQILTEQGFLEVQTPVLEHIPGGAEAEPFKTHHNALDQDFYLRISLELALKRLLVGGYERVFEIGRVFRNEGIDREHLQEFDHMEFYWSYADMRMGMKLVEEMYKKIVFETTGGYVTEWEGEKIDWNADFPVVDYFTEFKKETGIDLSGDVTVDMLQKKADELGIKYEKNYGKGRMIDTVYKKTVRQKLIQPCFLVGHPIEVSPLAKTDPSDPNKVLRFQPIACKSELGNGFAELNDPVDQRARFEEQMRLREAGDAEAQMLDEDFLQALEYGMPPACGFGMSERFFAILMNRSIRETVIFPPMKGREGEGSGKPAKKELQVAVAVINGGAGLEKWQELNTVAHLNAAFGARNGRELFFQDEIETQDGRKIRLNIQHAIMIKKAPSSEVMRELADTARKQGLEVAEFTREMLETTNDKKVIAATKEKKRDEVEYLGVLVFGEKGAVDGLTESLALYQ
jgi:lysyl-tRNA synthetase class 2